MEDVNDKSLDRRYSRSKKARETYIGTDSSGAEYWLVPFSEKTVGNRKFEIRKSKKQLPQMLKGMITDAAAGVRLFQQWLSHEKAKKAKPASKTAAK
jgi:hypothetical protein